MAPRHYRGRRQKPPKAPKIQLPPEPKFKDLKDHYKGIVSASEEIRIQAMVNAMGWFDLAIDFLMKKAQVDPATAKEIQANTAYLTKGLKARSLGEQGATNAERDAGYRTACRQLEKYCLVLIPHTEQKMLDRKGKEILDSAGKPEIEKVVTEGVDFWFAEFDKQKAELEAAALLSEQKYGDLVLLLEQAFPAAGLKFKVTPDVKGRKYDGAGTMMYGKDIAKEMVRTMKREGLLKIIANEIVPVTRVMSIVDDGQGGHILDVKKQILNIDQMLKGFVAYCQSDAAPNRIVRKGNFVVVPPANNAAPAQQAAPKQPRAAGVPRQPRTGAGVVGGRYRVGSSIATLYSRMSDQQEHDKRDLFAGLQGAESGKDAPFNRLLRHVNKFGEFTIDVNGSKVKMTINKP